MNRNDLASRLVRKLQEMGDKKEAISDEEYAIDAAKEISENDGIETSPEMIRQALNQVKEEEYESRPWNRIKKYSRPVLSFLDSVRSNVKKYSRPILLVGGGAGSIALLGYGVKQMIPPERPEPSGFVEGIVLEERGVGNPDYAIKIETSQGIYTIEFDDYAGSRGPKTPENLSMAIDVGTRVRFPTENMPSGSGGGPAGFSDRVGVLDPDNIEIIH